MPKTYTRDQAQAIWDVTSKMSGILEAALRAEGWGVKTEWDGDWWCRIEKFIPDPTGEDKEENERNFRIVLDVTRDGTAAIKTHGHATDVDVPILLKLLGEAMKPLVGPYNVANAEW